MKKLFIIGGSILGAAALAGGVYAYKKLNANVEVEATDEEDFEEVETERVIKVVED